MVARPGGYARRPHMATTVPSRPRRADAERNRSRILAAASELFAERGLDASMPELAERAGVGVGTLYRAFPDKDHLLGAVMAERLRWLAGEIEAAIQARRPVDGLHRRHLEGRHPARQGPRLSPVHARRARVARGARGAQPHARRLPAPDRARAGRRRHARRRRGRGHPDADGRRRPLARGRAGRPSGSDTWRSSSTACAPRARTRCPAGRSAAPSSTPSCASCPARANRRRGPRSRPSA